MDYEAYRKSFFAEPQPKPRFAFVGARGVSISVVEHDAALAYYTEVFGPPAYIEGEGIHGWLLADTWFTLFQGESGGPTNSDVSLQMQTTAEAERLHAALIAAGGNGEAPSDEIMYTPIRFCAVEDPFGLQWIVYASLSP